MIRNVVRESEYQAFIFPFENTVGSYLCEGIHIFFVFTGDIYLYLYISMCVRMYVSIYK